MYQNLVRSVAGEACESVHHCDWPVADASLVDGELVQRMGLAMQIAALGRSARSASNVKLRQPLAKALVSAGPHASRLGDLADLVTDELNVKLVEFVEEEGDLVRYEIGLLPKLLGPKYGSRYPRLRQAVANADAAALARRFKVPLSVELDLGDGEPPVELLPEEVEVRALAREGYAVAEEKGLIVAVDVTLTPELEREGLARDLVRRIQNLRKEAGFQLDDRIVTFCDVDDELKQVVEEWADYLKAETLSLELVPGPVPGEAARRESFKLEGHPVTLGVRKV
jgi:isoleucyl-tRNA synthetase